MFNTHTYVQRSWLLILTALVLVASCKDKEKVAPQTTTQQDNDWILEQMQAYYLWNDKIPANPNKSLAPEDFFESLLYRYDAAQRPDGDRFSFISEDAGQLKAALSGEEKTTGAEFALFRESQGSDQIVAQILFVHPGSPAAAAGLKRGDLIYQVNNQQLTTANYNALLFNQTSLVFGLAKFENNQLTKTSETRSLTAQVIQEDPVLLDSIYTFGSRVVGYLVYTQFIPGPNGSNNATYDQKVDQIFQSFKSAGVNELVLDLRYNPGGYVSSSVNLASLVGKGVDESKVYYRQEWNAVATPELKRLYGEDFFVEKFKSKAQNIGGQLDRVYVLTTGHTASASELVINGLRPYMDVVTIGTTTTGKNVGSITLSDDTKKVKWGLQPIVFKSYNSLNQSDYTAGFRPTIEVDETVDLKPFGDVQETLLNQALVQITGAPLARRGSVGMKLPLVGSSLDRKAGGRNMFIGELPK